MTTKKRALLLAVILAAVFLLIPATVFAEDIQSSKIFTGTQKLLNDAGTALMIIAPVAGIPIVAYFWFRRGGADEIDQKSWNKRIFVALVSIVGVELTGVIINVIMYYYG